MKFLSHKSPSRGQTTTRKQAFRRTTFERLEDRCVMAVDFASAFAVGGVTNENVYGMAIDSAGNTCIVGGFSGTVDFDPGQGVAELTSGGTFAAKYDPSGALLWAQRVAPSNSWFNFGPEIDAGADGSVYVVGTFAGTTLVGSTALTSAGSDDGYVVKFNPDGSFAWANRFGGVNADWGNDVAVDGIGSVYVMAETRDTGSQDAFIAKLDPAGNVLWSTEIGATSSTTTKGKNTTISGWARGYQLAVDGAGSVFATGRMSGTVDFDAGSGVTALAGTGFVLKLSNNGGLVWARTFEGGVVEPHDIAVDGSGNVFTTGLYGNSVDFDPGTSRSQRFILSASVDGGVVYPIYVSALNAGGNFLWAKSSKSTSGSVWAEAIALDGVGGVYIAGSFSGPIDFDPGASTYSLTPAGNADAFVWKLNTSGAFVWAGQMGGTTADRAAGVALDAAGNIFVAGVFSGTADFDPGPGNYNLTSNGGGDCFIAKLVQQPTASSSSTSLLSSRNELSMDSEKRKPRTNAAAVDLAFDEFDDKLSDLLLTQI